MKAFLISVLIIVFGKPAMAQVDSALTFKLKKPPTAAYIPHDSASGQIKPNTNIRICTPSKSQLLNPPLILIKSHNETLAFVDTGSVFKNLNLNPSWIKQMNIYKDSLSILKYGEAGKNGIIEIIINDEKFPDAFKSLKASAKK